MEGTAGADGVPLFACPVAGVTRPNRYPYDPVAMAGRAIVVDNGSHTFRAGWAGEDSPSVTFRSAIAKPRPKQGIPRTVVGDWGPGLSGWDFGKHTHRYCFEIDVPINMEGQEAMLDWALDRMQITGSSVEHPLLMTEAPLPPTGIRSQLAQLAFEAYGVPALSYVAAAPAAFFHHCNQAHMMQQQQQAMLGGGMDAAEIDQQQFCGSSSGLVICSGHSHSYVVPIYKGQPQWGASVRCWASGTASTGHLQQLLSVKYPLHAAGLLGNWQLVEGLKEGFCCAAADYRETLRAVAARPETAGGMGLRVQLPYVEASQPTAVDLAMKAQAARARGKALADMRRKKVLEQKEEQLALMKEVKAGVEDAEDEAGASGGRAVQQLLRQAHVGSQEELDKKIADLTSEVERLRSQLGVTAPATAVGDHVPADDTTAGNAMEIDQAAGGLDAAALAAAPVPVAAADSAAGTAATNTDAGEAGNEADNEQDDQKDDADTDSSSTVTLSDSAAAAVRAAGGPGAVLAKRSDATATSGAAAAAAAADNDEDSEATADEGNHSSSTVTDEGVFEQQGVLQEVLQQVKQIRKKQRQEVRKKVQQQERQQRRQQERQQQQMQQQQYEMEINYLGIPDSMLTAEQIKVKRRQQSMHAARMARERAAARKLQQQLEREQRMAVEDEQFATDPFTYLTFLQQRHNMTNARIEARKRKRLGQAPTTGVEEEFGEGAMVGKRRRDEKHRERMRLIAQAAAPSQKRDKKDKKGKDKKDKRHGDKLSKRDRKGSSSLDEEGFGDEAADWEVYRVMDIRGSDSEAEAEEAAELAWTTQRLQQIGAAVAAAAAAAVTAQAGTDAAAAAALQDDASTAATAAASSRAASQEPPDSSAAAGGSTLLDMAAAAVAGQLVTTAYPAAAVADGAIMQQQQQGLAGIDLNLLGLGGLGLGGEAQAQTQHLTAEDHQIFLGVERFRVPELLFQPMALAGVDQAGLSELVAVAMRRLPAHVAAEVAAGGVVLTGGNLMFPGLVSRIEAELRSIRPPDQPMKIYTSRDPLLDTWRGAAALAAATGRTGPAAAAAVGFSGSQSIGSCFMFADPFAAGSGALSRALYEEAGVDYLKEFKGFKYPEL